MFATFSMQLLLGVSGLSAGAPGPAEPPVTRVVVADPARAVPVLERLGFRAVAANETRRQQTQLRLQRGEYTLQLESGAAAAAGPFDRAPLGSAGRPVTVVVADEGGSDAVGKAVAELLRVPAPESLAGMRRLSTGRDHDGSAWHLTCAGGLHLVLRSQADFAGAPVPSAGELNQHVLDVLRRYPTAGEHRYHWPKRGGWKGNTRALVYGDELLCEGDPQGRCYCCGLTFEVFLDAWQRWCDAEGRPRRIANLDLAGVRRMQVQWFGSAEDHSCIHTALVANGLGQRVTDWEQARPGDFVQLWRTSGSGHSVVFLNWERDAKNRIIGLRYWSTQGSTEGIGERVEWFAGDAPAGAKSRGKLERDEFWLCRVGVTPGASAKR